MKNPGVLVGFLPLIVYGLLSGNSLESSKIALLAACIVAVLVGHRTLRRGFFLDWANLLMFAGALFCISVLDITAIADYMGIIIYLVLTLVAFGSLIAGIPFTSQYARDMVDKSLWNLPAFKSINNFMTGVWGGLFVVNLLVAMYSKFGTGPFAQAAGILVYVVLITGILFTILYPDYIRKKHPLNAS
ncbi:MAG: hypothetical protein LUQ71_05000 [Methanoregula sp.]|nr:hypothetical protein [Methanoregula sp.]